MTIDGEYEKMKTIVQSYDRLQYRKDVLRKLGLFQVGRAVSKMFRGSPTRE